MPKNIQSIIKSSQSFQEKLSDLASNFVGSWYFILIQTVFFLVWIGLNFVMLSLKWDPYPFVFLNLLIAFESVYITPLILMSQNKQEKKDRIRDDADYYADLNSEKNIEKIRKDIIEMKRELITLTRLLQNSRSKKTPL